ncbi:MAG: hypothetical protein LBS42_01835, partial [Tannerella sp.]|nr:hypothetical protein [Tannerella sp.]
QQAELIVPEKRIEGKPQTVSFAGIADVPYDSRSPIPLHATSDAGLPVCFYVTEGPAEIIDSRLVLTAMPPRAKFPVKVTVTAWQYGIDGKVQTAEPVARSFYITAK